MTVFPLNSCGSVAVKLNANNITTNNAGTKLTLDVVACTVNESLTIGSNTEFDANGLDLTIKGGFINSGTFTPSNNNTYFSGTLDQSITGVTKFYNFTKNTTNTVTLNNDITVNNILNSSSGIINDGGKTLYAKGDMVISNTI